MGVQKNIGILKAKVEALTTNLQTLILEEKQTRDYDTRSLTDYKTYART